VSLNPSPPPVFDVTEADFEAAVLERSLQVPVLLDCWAPWCGPCRALGPVLEKLARESGGRFVLAKINTDKAPRVSAALQIRSIPLVVLFIDGQPVDQFLGALPEGEVRAFLDRHLKEAMSPVDALRAEAAELGDDQAVTLLRRALAAAPGHRDVTLDLAERLISLGKLVEARKLLGGVPADARGGRHAALTGRLELAANRPVGNASELAARIRADPKDFEARFDLGAIHAHEGHWPEAFEQLLEIVLRDKGEWREKARQQLVAWFDVCPDAEAVSRGRRYLGMYLH
jgi:putative thioredoxin